ncbi:YdeI/OmpD-associated family protein [Devosia sp. ZB163]|uniref:YdeI/OmpD-associated family protein n=1 Tax=Devosia sp. ZB163 TaxID=3025938 RepID=UPI002362EF58|nr:YdeI/OmpD-associated family protein [Devosia sp. ZB163]MDC9825698.1 YdeI/OmpD-associated family protein [Devosia sp. ZB163]
MLLNLREAFASARKCPTSSATPSSAADCASSTTPAHPRNDYLLWINKAKREATKHKHLAQMLDELEIGGVYTGMKWNG